MTKWDSLSETAQSERLKEQSLIEERMLQNSIIKYWREYDRAPDEGIPEQQLLDSAVIHLAPYYQEWIDKVCSSTRSPKWVYPLMALGAAKMADLTFRCMMKCWFTPGALREREYSSPPIAQNVATLIANEALAIIDYQQAKEEFRDDWMRQSKFIKNWTPKRC